MHLACNLRSIETSQILIGTRRRTGSHATGAIEPSWHEITGTIDMPPTPIHFNQLTGPTMRLPPIQFYEKLVDDTVMGIIVQETNRLE